MYIRSDESDYIRIGNRIIPKDASSYGDASYDQISQIGKRNYDAEIAKKEAEEAERQAEAIRQEAIRQGQIVYTQVFSEFDPNASVDDQLQYLFEALVPSEGQCENLGGELVRAMMRVMYRDYNDGDVFYEGYGLETCGSDAAFIIDKTEDSDIDESFYNIACDGLIDDAYTNALTSIAGMLIDYLRNNPQVFGEPTEDSRSYQSRTLQEIADSAPEYTYDVDVSGDLGEYVENGCISWDDVYQCLRDWAEYDLGGEVHRWAQDGFEIVNLDREQYEDWERTYPTWLMRWLNDLEREFPNYGIEEEEYEDEEYDEEEY